MEYILILFFINFSIYILFLIINIISLLLFSSNINNQFLKSPVSVIVAIRNGQKALDNLINDLLSQEYSEDIEFILVDDRSVDKTKKIIQNAEKKHPQIKYVSSSEGDPKLSFKKRALDAGIEKSNHDILLFTDVDCQLGKYWVSSMAENFDKNTDYVIGFSRSRKIFGLANLFQRIDFLMLMFSAKSVAQIGWPLASSGQNQAYRKSLFKKVGGYKKISHLLMGDDSIFLQLCLKHNAKVKFSMNSNSYVFCRSEKTWKSLFLQRMRWAGDGNIMWRYNFLFYLIMLSTALSNIFIFFLISSNLINLLFIIIGIKFMIEIIFAFLGANYFKERISISGFIYWHILNALYVPIMSVASFFVRFLSWKNRGQ